MTLHEFMLKTGEETYPEPITQGHSGITDQIAPIVAALIEPNACVLDVGCGQGPALEWFEKRGFCVEGIRSLRTKLSTSTLAWASN